MSVHSASISERVAQRIQPKPWYVQAWRMALIWTINIVGLRIALALLPNVSADSSVLGFYIFAGVVAILNAIIRPTLVRLMMPITMLTLGLVTFVINGLMFSLADRLLPIINFTSFWQAIWLSILVALITWIAQIFLSIDDADSYFYAVVKKMGTRRDLPAANTKKTGFLYLEIDGLANPILHQALSMGVMPNLQQLLKESHKVTQWETDLPAQTCASQAGILHGNNWNVIGFRWYDRVKKLMFTASNPAFVNQLESRISNGKGLLAGNGAGVGNMFTGDAQLTAFCTSASGKKGKSTPYNPLSYYFVNPYNYVHTVALVFWEIVHEYWDRYMQDKQQRAPRIHRGLETALQRAFMCVIVPDIAVQTAIGEMYAGRDAIYITYPGYDELSHLGGLNRPEVMRGLRRIDTAIFYLLLSMKAAPKPYELIVLSDHGQSMGWTFEHEFNRTLGSLVQAGCHEGTDVKEVAGVDEIGIVIGDMLTDIRKSLRSKFSLNLFRSIAKKISRGSGEEEVLVVDRTVSKELITSGFAKLPEVLVQVGGNLAMIYFTKADRQLDLSEITRLQKKLLPTLVAHPGIGLAMVASKQGPLVFGKDGKHYINIDGKGGEKIVGIDPLLPFGPDAAMHLRRVASFDTCPDILLISTYDPASEEIIGFEHQCGAHGALGGPQSKPFLVYPKKFALQSERIIGAEQIYHQLKKWQQKSPSAK